MSKIAASTPVSRPNLHAFWREWFAQSGPTWIFILQGMSAVFVTLWLAMRLELPQPVVSCMTVVIVMQPQSGQVLMKSIFRLLGTVIGSFITLVLVASVAQEPVLFLLAVALWVGVCAAGAMAFRDYRSYAFVLAGYTATLIGLPAVQQPDAVFMMAVWRVLEISLGIVCASIISACLFPQTASFAMKQAVYRRFGLFADFLITALSGKIKQTEYEQKIIHLAAEAGGLENLRSVSSFEDPNTRMRSRRLARLNHQFMQLTTRFSALYNVLIHQEKEDVKRFFTPCFEIVKQSISAYRLRALTPVDAAQLSEDITHSLPLLRQTIRTQQQLAQTQLNQHDRLDFDTACELLERLLTTLQDYCMTHASLAHNRHAFEQDKNQFTTRVNRVGAVLTGIRTAFIVLAFSFFWMATAWPAGMNFAMIAIAISALMTTSPQPVKAARQITGGTILAAITGCLTNLVILPGLDDIVLLCLVLSPVLIAGFYLASKPNYMGYGMGLLLFYCFGSIPLNPAVYDPVVLINNYLALIIAQSLVVVILSVVAPPDSRLIWQRLIHDMRQLIVTLCQSDKAQTRAEFESVIRDLLNQSYGFSADAPHAQRELLRWMFIVQNVGHALIELDQELASHSLGDKVRVWQSYRHALNGCLVALFREPSYRHLVQAQFQIELAMTFIAQQHERSAGQFSDASAKRITSYLHFIRTALLDNASPLMQRIENRGEH